MKSLYNYHIRVNGKNRETRKIQHGRAAKGIEL